VDGCSRRPLHRFGMERVDEIGLAQGAAVELEPADVCQEVLVLDGAVEADAAAIDRLGWLRVAAGHGLALRALAPTRLFWKTRPGAG